MKCFTCTPATESTARAGSSGRRGSVLLATLVVLLAITGLLYATTMTSTDDLKHSRASLDALRAKHIAAAGIERGIHFLRRRTEVNALNPLDSIQKLFEDDPTFRAFVGEPILDGGGRAGSFSLSMSVLDSTSSAITLALDSTGYLPASPGELADGEAVSAWYAMQTVVRFRLAPSPVFNYGYFINNWGWLYGNTIFCNGNARSNGQFDAGGYAPTITGQPMYEGLEWIGTNANLVGYQDDNGDGLNDGNDGGLWSGWDIVGAQNVKGNGGKAANQHDFDEQIAMPNLSNLGPYEAAALENASSISIGGTEVCDAVYGDEPGELQNLYLVGTAANPIVIDGPVVVHGDVIISGVVKGKGAIYSGGNVYCPNSVIYADPPSTPRPAGTTQAATEAWLTANQNKDFLGLFARENVVLGDHTNATWRYYQNYWMNDPLNESAEDSGVDQIPNTAAGRDGILGTADDDLLEGDGLFSVEHYTQADADAGLIPSGSSVGDPIPGSGEDIDGDGIYDDTTSLADIDFKVPLDTANWGGNMPPGGISNYNSIASLYANRFDATFYTNHSLCWLVLGSTPAQINGAVVCRNENMIYGTPSVQINHDARLLGGASGIAAPFLPTTLLPIEELRWRPLTEDPNRYLEP